MNGRLHLVCGANRDGQSVLAKQYFHAPMHISKPYWEGRVLVVNAMNSTAGLFSGDKIFTSFEVRGAGQMLVTSASASRVHRMESGAARVSQTCLVRQGGWLEIWPPLFIPQAGSNYSQKTRIEVEKGGELLWFEAVAPGRVAHGESWQFARFENDFALTYDGALSARERYALTPESPAIQVLRKQFPTGYSATCYAVGRELTPLIRRNISELHGAGCWVGCTCLDAPITAIRVVAADSMILTRVLAAIREFAHAGFGRVAPRIRRT